LTELLYQRDCYLREFDARITCVDGDRIILDKTMFNPRAGGLSCDTGYLIRNK